MAMWGMIELVKDPALYRDVRKEVQDNCMQVDPNTGARSLDAQKMLKLPLLKSLYVETLRLHVSVNVTREVTQSQSLGSGYEVETGALLQAPSQLAHYDEEVWRDAHGEHPATEFWARRHTQYIKKTNEAGQLTYETEFSMGGRVGSYFPYGMYIHRTCQGEHGSELTLLLVGGGISICPGRHFAMREIMFTLGALVARFDVEFIGWTHKDGSRSDRPAQNDKRFAGAVGMPPDRDMKFKWKRIW